MTATDPGKTASTASQPASQATAGFLNTDWNPRDVQNNIASGQFGTFFNSPDRSVRLKFEFVKY